MSELSEAQFQNQASNIMLMKCHLLELQVPDIDFKVSDGDWTSANAYVEMTSLSDELF